MLQFNYPYSYYYKNNKRIPYCKALIRISFKMGKILISIYKYDDRKRLFIFFQWYNKNNFKSVYKK